ncbi:MAG TPA: hypothetical protein VLV82_00220 [Candidatus Angelobacter sp.]|nr:hypothetical protein [Candidatus Angelobacter sp.]
MVVPRRAGALTAWGTAYLLGSVSLDEADAAVVGTDAVHRVVGAPGEPEPVPVSLALARLRARGVTALRLVLPEAGDPTGLPGPASFSAAAVAAGAAVVTVGPPDVPSYAALARAASSDGAGDVVRWDLVEVLHSVAPYGLPTLSEADRGLTEAMAASTSELAALDVARGRDDVAPRLAGLDRAMRDVDLPATLPARAQRLVATATRLLGVLDIAAETDGGSVTATEARGRLVALRPLRTAVRYALCAAYSAAAEDGPSPGRR